MFFDSTMQTISWFKTEHIKESLVIKPPYQRKPVWTARQKCYFIESILRGLPIPEIFVQLSTTPEGDSNYGVVDGQQRIRTVLQFIGVDRDPQEQEYNKFVLDKLPAASPWRGKAFAELDEDTRKRFYEYKFAVRYLKEENESAIRDMFVRLNKFLTPLNPQELRHALYSGPFVRLVEKLADDDYWTQNTIVSPANIRRMKDLEFVSNLLIGVMHGPQGGESRVVDDYYAKYEDYDDEFPGQKRAKELFFQTLSAVKELLPSIKDTRWANMTDFYTLFVAIASQLRTKRLVRSGTSEMRNTLISFEKEVDQRLADEKARVSDEAIKYVRAVEKGANDKKRRADRHKALLRKIADLFAEKK